MATKQAAPKRATKPKARWVVVTTDKRGVFCGLTDAPVGADPIVLEEARMCVYWDTATRGVLGLAATGPTAGCRITAAPPRVELRGITAVMDCSPEAVAAWQRAPWG